MVSETCREGWSTVYSMNPYEFFNILAYRIDKNNEEKRQIDAWKRLH